MHERQLMELHLPEAISANQSVNLAAVQRAINMEPYVLDSGGSIMVVGGIAAILAIGYGLIWLTDKAKKNQQSRLERYELRRKLFRPTQIRTNTQRKAARPQRK